MAVFPLNQMIPENITAIIISWIILAIVTLLVIILIGIFFYFFTMWYRWKDREKHSLELVTLLVTVPQDNEVKIDATENILASLGSLYKSPKFKFLSAFSSQASFSLEIVGTHQDIKFYVCIPKKYQDLIEKQFYSVYAGADIRAVDEPNIFFESGHVEYSWLGQKNCHFILLKLIKKFQLTHFLRLHRYYQNYQTVKLWLSKWFYHLQMARGQKVVKVLLAPLKNQKVMLKKLHIK